MALRRLCRALVPSPPRLGRSLRRGCTVLFALLLGCLAVWGGSLPASASPGVTVNPTTTTTVRPDATTTLTGLSIDGADPGDTPQVTVGTRLGTLTFPETDGLTLAFGNDWSGTDSVTFTGSQDDINTALAAVELVTGHTGGQTTSVTISVTPSVPGYVFAADNGHFYSFVEASGISWSDALSQAATKTFEGQQGYLATIPNGRINDLISSRIQGATNVWFGAQSIDTFGDGIPHQRTWQWSAGPLQGDPVSYCSNVYPQCDFVDNDGLYNSWAPGEPNNAGVSEDYNFQTDSFYYIPYSGEDYPVTNWQGSIGQWNDLPNDAGFNIAGYVVEFGDQVNGASTFDGVVTGASDVRIVGVPDAPTDVAATTGNAQASVSFVAPADNGSVISGYTVTITPADGGASSTQTCAASPCTITGLDNGSAYTFSVVANSDQGDGPSSDASNTVVPATVPSAPTDVSAVGGDGQATVSFAAGDDGGSAITSYTVTSAPGGLTATCPSSPCVITGLDNGTDYTFTVVATNGVGDSDPSEASDPTSVRTVPHAPVVGSVSAGNGSASVHFSPPVDNGGASVTGYTVTSEPDGITAQCTESPCDVTGLTNGTAYTFTVTATNAAGTSASSDPSDSVTPSTVPGVPQDLTVTRHSTSADLSFGAPGDDGGSAITGYEVSTDGGDHWTTLSTSGTSPITATVSGLTNGTTYTVYVRAVNANGHGEAASRSNVIPADVPDAPTGVTVTTGDRSVAVSWVDGADNGSTITGYRVVVSEDGQDDYGVDCDASPCTINGLANGHHYTFTVRATNDVGNSAYSDPSDTATPATTADAPDLDSIVSLAGAVRITFEPGSDDGGATVTGYQSSVNGGAWTSLDSTVISGSIRGATITGLTNGVPVTVRVRAVNSVGVGAASNARTQTPATVPSVPRNVKVATANGKVTVTWDAPTSNGGSPVNGYVVQVAETNELCLTMTRSCVFTDLPPGHTYTFLVGAFNQVSDKLGSGVSAPVITAPVVITDVPGAPTGFSVKPGDRSLGLRFTAPTDNGGKPITGYQVSTDGGKHWSTLKIKKGSPITATVAPVLNGAAFKVEVRAVNANGAGPGTAIVSIRTTTWFADPISKANRAKEVAVPKKPSSYHGKLKHTKATNRSHNGTIAYPVGSLKGRQLQPKQAVELGGKTLFPFDSGKLSSSAKKAIKSLAGSLRYVTSISCEGYADYGGSSKHETALSKARAKAVCAELKKDAKQLSGRVVIGYGAGRPVVIGGKASDRAANRRVVVVIKK